MRTRLLIIGAIIVVVILVGLLIIGNRGKKTLLGEGEFSEQAASLSDILNEAKKQESEGNLQRAKELYVKLVDDFSNYPKVAKWQEKIGQLNTTILFSPAIIPGSILYEIQSGDSLAKIAKKYNTTVELLKRSNGLSSDKIIKGNKLKVWTKPFNIVVDKSQNTLILKFNDEVLKIYTVSTGINNSTPVGNFKIINKLVNPTWHKPGAVVPPESPDNILGSRWMGINREQYGIHGTTEPQTLGQQITQGCVRMSNSDVEELFSIVPVGTEVTIID